MRALLVALAVASCAAPRSTPAAPDRSACSGPWSFEVVDEGGAPLPTYRHRGRLYVRGEAGQRYLLRVRNGSGQRVEVVASVDGRDVVNGRPASWDARGYLVPAYGELTIDGFRLGASSVAAFRFGSVEDSYAARMGDARDVGVIGVAVFPEAPAAIPAPVPFGRRDRSAPGGERAAKSADAAPAAPPSAGAPQRFAEARPGLGTEFGEEHASPVEHVAFRRASASPAAVLAVRYDDRRGLLALGIDVDRLRPDALRESATPFRQEGYAEPPPGWRR